MINLMATGGELVATHIGVAISKVRIGAEGELPWTGVSEGILEGIVSLCTDTSKVTLRREGTVLLLKCRGREESTVALTANEELKVPSVKNLTGIEISDKIGPRVSYLAALAHSDTSRAELCCVMMTATGELLACSPKVIASLKGRKMSENIAVPLVLAKSLSAGDVLYPGPKSTVVKTAIATYSMPAPVKAQQNFPIAKIVEFSKSQTTKVASVAGEHFTSALEDCKSCLSRLSSDAEILVDLRFDDKGLALSAASGPTIFKAPVSLITASNQTGSFRAPLEEMLALIPFMTTDLSFERGEHDDLFIRMPVGWAWFPCYLEHKKK